MDATVESQIEGEAGAVREQLERVLASEFFASGERQCRFLRYVVESTLDGKASQLNQFAVGIEVFDRDATFDPSTDAVVRVEAGRLRAKLAEYYSSTGASDPVVIGLPKGGYAASIEFRPISITKPAGSAQIDWTNRNRLAALSVALVIVASVYFGFLHTPSADRNNTASGGVSASADGLGSNQAQPANTGVLVPPAIAVLPFENMSNDSDQDYFSDGITEDIITDLSMVSGLTVIARHSTFVYKGRSISIGDVGRDLNVQYVLEGSVRRSGKQIRITAQLIDAETEAHLWAQRYDREVQDVFVVQDDVTRKIVESLQVTLTDVESQHLGQRGTENIQAFDFLIRAQEHFYAFTPDGVATAIDLMTQSVGFDPMYADALAWKSRALVYQYVAGFELNKTRTVDAAIALARQSIEQNPNLPTAHASLAWALRWDSKFDEASDAIEVAIGLNPNFADAYLWKSLILSSSVRGDESIAAARRGMRLNPNYGVTYIFALGRAHFASDNNEIALEQFNRGILRNPSFLPNHVYKLFTLERLGRLPEVDAARAELESANPNYRESASYQFYLNELNSLSSE